jgi:hypothetical protein
LAGPKEVEAGELEPVDERGLCCCRSLRMWGGKDRPLPMNPNSPVLCRGSIGMCGRSADGEVDMLRRPGEGVDRAEPPASE